MAAEGEGQGTISVRCVGWTGLSAALVKVLIDDREVGVLPDKRAHEFAVAAGTHRVEVKRDFWRSLPLDVAVHGGVRSELECGFHVPGSMIKLQLLSTLFSLALVLVLALVVTGSVPFWSLWVVLGVEVVAVGFVWWRLFTPPGAYLFLHAIPQDASVQVQKS
jgi:hypothetical protein